MRVGIILVSYLAVLVLKGDPTGAALTGIMLAMMFLLP